MNVVLTEPIKEVMHYYSCYKEANIGADSFYSLHKFLWHSLFYNTNPLLQPLLQETDCFYFVISQPLKKKNKDASCDQKRITYVLAQYSYTRWWPALYVSLHFTKSMLG